MVDLPLMARVVAAVKPGARVVLIGDPDQLAAVGAGAVLAELCRPGLPGPVGEGVVQLVGSQRYDETGEVAALARAIHTQDVDAVLGCLTGGGAVTWERGGGPLDRDPALVASALRGWQGYAAAGSPEERLRELDRFRILCATRRGPSGVAALNAAVERALQRAGHLDTRDPWYPGRPVMVTANDYGVGLYNGDVGVVERDARGAIRVFFPTASGVRAVLPTRLPEHETVFATTIHKSQGSEFDEVVVALPPRPHRGLTRELLYTAVTRARDRVVIHGTEEVVATAVRASTPRRSGLRDALRDRTA
jgi:exodeoxyribonuclease V alpha subunit